MYKLDTFIYSLNTHGVIQYLYQCHLHFLQSVLHSSPQKGCLESGVFLEQLEGGITSYQHQRDFSTCILTVLQTRRLHTHVPEKGRRLRVPRHRKGCENFIINVFHLAEVVG
jgi:hypothetical protein